MALTTRNQLSLFLLGLAILSAGMQPAGAEPKLLRSIDFAQPDGTDAAAWLKSQGFELLLDADKLKKDFSKHGLNISTTDRLAGMFKLEFPKKDHIANVQTIRIEWGVNRFPMGADWEKGINRLPVAIMFSFGNEKLSSGLPFGINSAPYFLSPFIGEKEDIGKMYIGKLYKNGGRYFCVSHGGPPIGDLVTTEFEVDKRFREVFEKDNTPPITGVAFQMNTDDTQGGADAFIKKIDFLGK